MKRVISLLLCLVMCVSVFSATATQVYALGQTDSIFSVEKTAFENDRITYTISLAPNQSKLIGAIIKVEFDSTILEVSSESGEVGSVNSYGDFAANVTGFYEKGITYDNDNIYSVAYMNPNGFNIGENAKQFIKIVFNAIGEERPETEVKFYCEEYITDDEDDTNDIRSRQLIDSDSFLTLNPAKNVDVASCVEGLKFTWTEAVGAEWYNVYRKEADGDWGDEPYARVDAGVTEFVDTEIDEGVEYCYSIEAANQYGVIEYDKKGLVGFNFGTITEIDATITERGALVSWGALNNAVSYTVYRKAEGETSWKQIAETAETTYEDEPLTSAVEYSYTIKAHHEKGYSAETSVDPAKITFIANATIVEYQLNYKDIVINWQSVDGAASYEIYRKATGEKEYTYLAAVSAPGYTDTAVEDGKEYSYQVRSITENGAGSVRGETGFDLVKLPITTEVVATLGGDNVTVSWAPTALAEEYVIVREDNNNGNWYDVATVPASQTKYADRAVRSGRTYTYAIKSKADGMVTSQSNASNSVYYLVAPVVESLKNGSKGMEFTFKAVEGASAYNIYRREVNGQFGNPIGTISADDELIYIDSTAVSGVKYVYGVQSVYGNVLSGISTSSVVCCLEEPKITVGSIYNGIEINWKAVPSAEKYVVYYGLSRDLEDMMVLGETTSTSFVYDNGVSGRNNYFAVEAVCGETVSTKTQQYIYYFAAPVINYVENGTNQITLRWNFVNGAESYLLYRKAGNASSWTHIATVYEDEDLAFVQYKDTSVKSGTVYKYTVKAYDGDEYSAYNKTGWTAKEFLSTPKLSSVANAYGGVKVSWSKVTGAKKYTVYRRTKSTSWKSIGSTTSTSYTDTSAVSNKKYYYAVRAVDGSSQSYYSTSHFDSVCKTVNYLAAPVVKASNTSSGVKVSWGKVSGAQKYVVYRKKGSAKSWTKVKTTTSTSYTDKSVKSGTTYKYAVRAQDGSILSSYKSSGTSIKFLSTPTLSSVSSGKSGVTFKWKKVTGASGYYVYRKTGSGSFQKIATVKGSTKVSYLDKSAKKGKTYTYTVRAYYSSYTSYYKTGLKIKDKY